MPVLHVHVADEVFGDALSFACVLFDGSLGDLACEVVRRAKRKRDGQSYGEQALRALSERIASSCDVYAVACNGDRRPLPREGRLHLGSGDQVFFRSQRQRREAYRNRCIPSPAGLPCSPITRTPPVPAGSVAAQAIDSVVWAAPSGIDKELCYEEDESVLPQPASPVGDLWVQAWVRCGSSAELMALLTPHYRDFVEALVEGNDAESLMMTGRDTAGEGGQSVTSLGFRSAWNGQFSPGMWGPCEVPPEGDVVQSPLAALAGEVADMLLNQQAEAADTVACEEEEEAPEVGSEEDCPQNEELLQSPLVDYFCKRMWYTRADPVRIKPRNAKQYRQAKEQIEQLASQPATVWASQSMSPRRQATLSPGSPASPILRCCDDVLDAEYDGDAQESTRAYKRLLASLRRAKGPCPTPPRPTRPARKRVASQDKEIHLESVYRRNLQREESAAWVRILKEARRLSIAIQTSARQRAWESACVKKRYFMRTQWVVIASETSRRNTLIYQELEEGMAAYQLIHMQEMEMLRRVAIFAAWDAEWDQVSTVLLQWRRTLDDEARQRAEEPAYLRQDMASSATPDSPEHTAASPHDYEREMELIEEHKEALSAAFVEEQVSHLLEVERDEWESRHDSWRKDRERMRLDMMHYPPTPYGVLQAHRRIPYIGGDFTKARAEHHHTRTSPTNRVRSLAHHPEPQSADSASPSAWPFEHHRRRLEDKLFRL